LKGATAFITTDLEDLLIKFAVFLRASRFASDTVVDVTYDFGVSVLGIGFQRGGSRKANVSQAASKGFSASINTEDFQARFERDSYRLSLLIKEVTLGSAARKT